ncbi:DUF5133 domain-containing protein [Streptomyces sp. URMC 123]|uniref:DUF5133 domain-containing protein n=1 Tax=Streptomyces sp. URMC 123 TaxID=3423403 RepID=UPI003F1CF1CF
MLMAHPAVLRNLVERYEELEPLTRRETVAPETHRAIQDCAYTLCVSTGTRTIEDALVAARSRLAACVH